VIGGKSHLHLVGPLHETDTFAAEVFIDSFGPVRR
jgi:hypothetical protein